jgi:prepilin-type N-terminal cleavage/methylation domain-containing protein
MKKLVKDQNGFTLVELIIGIVIVSAIGFTAYYVHHSQQSDSVAITNDSSTNTGALQANKVGTVSTPPTSLTTGPQTGSTATSAATTAPIQYLNISEWGVRVQLSAPISDAYYGITDYETDGTTVAGIGLSLTSLKSTQCQSNGWSPSEYFRYTSADKDPVTGEFYTQENGTAHQIGSYYYAYEDGYGVDPSGGCESTAANQSLADAAAVAFKAALNTIQPTN